MSSSPRVLGFAVLLAALLPASDCSGCSSKAPSAPPKHVLLIVIDTQRADHLSCYGYPRATSPTIDALAVEGVLFERAVSQASWTLPSMVLMMTSSYLAEDGVFGIPADRSTLAEAFKKGGYSTGAFICNDLLSPENHFERGFDEFQWQLVPYGSNQPILDWIRAHAKERTFTYVHLNEVHDDVKRPDGSNYGPEPLAEKARFRNEKGALSKERLAYFDGVTEKLHLQEKDTSVAKIGAEIGGYDDDVLYCDGRIREILAEYRKLGLWDSTAVVVGADHGEGLWTREQFFEGTRRSASERGEAPTLVNTLQMTHGSQAAIELVHVPLVLRAPGIARGRVPGWVENVDIAPTLLALCGIAKPASMQGRSLLELARDTMVTPASDALADGVVTFTRFQMSVISADSMQLLHPTPRGECDFGLADELYDLSSDPEARRNLLPEKRDLGLRLAAIGAKRTKIGIRGGPTKVGPMTQRSIEGLGYGEGGVVDSIREELAAAATEELFVKLKQAAYDCLMRLEVLRALRGRELTEAQRADLRQLLENESSEAVRGELRGLLPR
jgi:arylsulfatase A-like enzyme